MDELRRIWKWGLFILMTVAFAFGIISAPISTKAASGNTYYVAPNGNDSNPGTIEEPWRTLAPVHARDFLPGDVIHFKRGGVWSGGLVIDDSGVQDNPITFIAYGTGARPIFTNPGGAGSYTRVIKIDADWVVVEGFLVQDAHESGIYISNGSDHNIIRDIETTNVGIGIAIHGQHNLATQNYLHDLHMIVNTIGGNDDYGAVGIGLFNSNNEVSYNRMVNCKASSYDYGTDGGAVEWYGVADNNYVHHNWAGDCAGFLEVGGGSAKNTIVAYNVSVNNGRLSWIHLSGEFASVVNNFRVENNTIIETSGSGGWVVLGFNGDPTENTFILRNNIFYVDGFDYVAYKSGFAHDQNHYYLSGGTQLGFSLGQGEATADPLFVNLAARDFHLQPGSPAIDSGIDLGYSLDFDDLSVPFGTAPDLGVFEYQTVEPTSTPGPSPTPSETPSSTPLTADINQDGQVDVLDTQLCVNVVLGTETDPVIVARADVNTDGEVNVLDVQEIINVMLAN